MLSNLQLQCRRCPAVRLSPIVVLLIFYPPHRGIISRHDSSHIISRSLFDFILIIPRTQGQDTSKQLLLIYLIVRIASEICILNIGVYTP